MITDCMVLKSTIDTPWSYTSNPRHLPGPWGETEEDALEALRYEAEFDIEEYWVKGKTI